MQDITDSFEFYYSRVLTLAMEYGYSASQVKIFEGDIMDCWQEGKSVGDCVDEVFK